MSKSLKHFETMDVFLSYRRLGGATVAALLYRELSQRGLRVFMDTEELENGDYEKAIIKNIKSSKNFILLVSENVFESENVILEIKTALSIKKMNIIPIFINNSGDFSKVPKEISALRNMNGVTLNHVNFDESINSIYKRVTSRVDDLIFKITEEFDSDSVEYLLEKLKVIDSKIQEKTFSFIKMLIRERVNNIEFSERIETLDSLFRSIYTEDVKSIAKSLGIDNRGSPSNICARCTLWLNRSDSDENPANDTDAQDRFFILRDAVVDLFEGRENFQIIKEIFYTQGLGKPSPARSSKDYINHLFNISYDTEEIFNILELNQDNIKFIAVRIFGDSAPKKKKSELIDYISQWTDYLIE